MLLSMPCLAVRVYDLAWTTSFDALAVYLLRKQMDGVLHRPSIAAIHAVGQTNYLKDALADWF